MKIEGSGAANRFEASDSGNSGRVQNAASQFEAMLIGQMLKSVREAGAGLGGDSEESMTTYSEIAEQQFAQALSAGGGLGIAKMVTEQIGGHNANQ
jgi:peptidoglycan hydrolase FlgJ